MDEAESKVAMVAKFRETFIKIINDESSAILYPNSTTSSDIPISAITRLPRTYTELKWYIPSLSPPVKDGNISYGQIYIGKNTPFDDWEANFLEWTKNNGHCLFMNFVQDERTTPVGSLLYTHNMSNVPWYQTLLSKKSGIRISARFRNMSG